MLEIIPAIDIIDGRCVRLTRGDYNRRTDYDADPVATACRFEEAGARTLHIVDLDGARGSQPCNLGVVERIASRTSLLIEFGGGLKSRAALLAALCAGAGRLVVGSVAATRPMEFAAWLSEWGGAHIALGVDTRQGQVSVSGWTRQTPFTASDLITRFAPMGLERAICTDIARDGMLAGPDIAGIETLSRRFPALTITMSGGVSSAADLAKLRSNPAIRSVIIGKALYERRLTLQDCFPSEPLPLCSPNV